MHYLKIFTLGIDAVDKVKFYISAKFKDIY
jgi:hypothetical protein